MASICQNLNQEHYKIIIIKTMNRKQFISGLTGLGLAAIPGRTIACADQPKTGRNATDDMPLGVMTPANNPDEDLKKVYEMGFNTCQMYLDDYSDEKANELKAAMEKYNISPTTLICMGPGKYVWNFKEGPSTIGLVPREMREERVDKLQKGIDFCNKTGIPAVHAHFGFIPEDPLDELYIEFIDTMQQIGAYAMEQGVDVYYETGQETPVTLVRAIEDIGTGNMFINFDTANFFMYGKGNAMDALDICGKYVKSLHAKDAIYPVDPYSLGKEKPIPEGLVDFPVIIKKLKNMNFKGHITIECELHEQKQDYIQKTKKYLEELIKSA